MRDPVRAQLELGAADDERDRRRYRPPHLGRDRLEIRSRDVRRVELHRQRDGEGPFERSERLDDCAFGGGAVELHARARGDEDRCAPLEPQRRVAVRPIHATFDPVELVLERGVVSLRRGRDIRAEEAHAQAAEAANRREAVTLVQRARDRAAAS